MKAKLNSDGRARRIHVPVTWFLRGALFLSVLIFATHYVCANMSFGQTVVEQVRTVTIQTENQETGEWESLGKCRITTYCPYCNDGGGHASSSGVYLQYGHAACSWLPIGTVICIDGEFFEIVDICGTDAIDLFIDSSDGCHCNLNEYREVSVRKEQ